MPNYSIKFEDKEVERICLLNWDTDGDMKLSYEEATAVTTLDNQFKDYEYGKNKRIFSFDELKYFTSLTQIEEEAFYDCRHLFKITIPEGVKEIGNHAFNGSGLQSITLNNGIKKIGAGAFYGSALRNIILPEGLTEIGSEAFPHLDYIVISSTVEEIGLRAIKADTIYCKAPTPPKIEYNTILSPNVIYVDRNSYNDYIYYNNGENGWYSYREIIQPYDFE